MGVLIPTFEALTLLPPKDEDFRCARVAGKHYTPLRVNLETVSKIAAVYYEADLGYRPRGKKPELGFRLGDYWFPITKARANRMFKRYGLVIAEN